VAVDQRNLLMHQAMLGDRERLAAYDRALAQALRPGDVAADVGAGTLALTALALRHGAAHVYAVEADPEMCAVGQRLVEANGWQQRVTVVQGDARLVRLPQRVDVLVAEMMGNLGPEEDMCRVMSAMARRNLRPGGTVIPERLLTSFAPAQLDGEGWGIWTADFLGMRLDAVQHLVEPRAHLHFFTRPPTLLADPAVVACSVRAASRPQPGVLPEIALHTAGQLHAVLGYFTAVLAPGITLSNFPSYAGCNWAVWVWPLRHTPAAAGDVLRMTVLPRDDERLVTDWRLDCQLLRKGAA
jgi:protein arginine N-methyltransferase 1